MLSLRYHIYDAQLFHERTEYSILDLFGEFGGVMEVFFVIGGILLASYSDYNFNIKALRKLYMVKTRDDNLFVKQTEHKADEQKDKHKKSKP